MTSSSQRTPAARMLTRDTTISMIGPPPMSWPLARAPEKVPKNESVWSPVAFARTSLTPSVAETTVYRISGVKAEARTVSQRKPMASEIAVVRGTPRTARLATARSHSRSVRMVEAAKTTAYCWRNLVLVKSTFAVSCTASLSLSTVQEAASAQPRASEDRGSRVSETPGLVIPWRASPFSQYFSAGPRMRSQVPLLEDGDDEGVGEGLGVAAKTRVAVSTAVA